MSKGLEQFNKHMERINLLENGGEIKCPNCDNGYIRKMGESVYMCNNCKTGITERVALDISA